MIDVTKQFNEFFGVNAQADARIGQVRATGLSNRDAARDCLSNLHKPEISAGHPTQSPLKDEQPRRAASPIPGTYTHTPGA